jgi:AraC-like DNA-binding protein
MPHRDNDARPGFATNSVPARYLRDLMHHLVQLGYDVTPALRKVGLSVDALNLPHARVDRMQVTRVMKELALVTGRTDLGFELGLLINLATVDVVGQLLLSSSTLAEGLQRVARFFALLTPSFRMQTTSLDGSTYRLLCEPSVPLPYDMAIQGLETLAVALHRLILFLMQEKSVPVMLDASWAAPSHAARYRELKGLRPRFGTSHYPQFFMTLGAGLADARLPMANPMAVEEAERSCRRMLEDLNLKGSWSDWVTRMLRDVDGYFPSQSDLASLLRVSAKTLTRHLAKEGKVYRSLAMEVRHQRSRDLLENSTRSLAEIAQTLGYSDAANFGRAFRQIEGITPGEYRQAAAR